MVTVARTKTGLWHVLGELGCQDADPSETQFEERRSLDEYEFRLDPIPNYPGIDSDDGWGEESGDDTSEEGYPERRVDQGVREEFCRRCRRTVAHWVDLRETNLLAFRARLADTRDSQASPASEFEEIAPRGEADEMCDVCGKPTSGRWHRDIDEAHRTEFVNNVEYVCMTCYRAIKEPLSDSQRQTGLFRAGLNEDLGEEDPFAIGGTPLRKPTEISGRHKAKERRENPQTDREKAIVAMGENIDGLGLNMASRVYGAGIHSLEALADSDPGDMTDVNHIGETKATDFIKQAREIV